MDLDIHKATAADAADLLITINEALRFKLSQNDMAWEESPFTAEDVQCDLARRNTYAVYVDGLPAGRVTLIWDDEHNWGERGLDNQAAYIRSDTTSWPRIRAAGLPRRKRKAVRLL